jgi:hypothetical protein
LFVHILALSDKNSHLIQVAVSGSLPDDPKTKFSLGIGTDIESNFVLAATGVAKFGISVRRPGQKLLADFSVSVIGGIVERSPASFISSIDVGSIS